MCDRLRKTDRYLRPAKETPENYKNQMDGGTEEKKNRDSEDVKKNQEELKDNVRVGARGGALVSCEPCF